MSGATEFETFHREMDGWLADLSQKPSTFAEADRLYTFGSTPKEAAELLRDERAQASKPVAGHTPGPWAADVMHDVNDDQGYLIACVHAGEASAGSPSGGDDIAEANARLIAAAPDLLDALYGMVEYLEPIADEEVFPEEYRRLQVALAAIAKAEGRS